jgi:hypothetical protein
LVGDWHPAGTRDASPLRIVYVGGSLTQGWYVTSPADSYPAIASRTIAQLRDRRVEWQVVARPGAGVAAIRTWQFPSNQDLVVVDGVTNDFLSGTPLPRFERDYLALLWELRADSPRGAFVCLGGWEQQGNTNQAHILGDAYDEVVQRACAEFHGLYVPLAQDFVAPGTHASRGDPSIVGPARDTLYPNDYGNQLISLSLVAGLEGNAPSPPSVSPATVSTPSAQTTLAPAASVVAGIESKPPTVNPAIASIPQVQAAPAPIPSLGADELDYQPSAFAEQDIPPAYLALFQEWAAQYGIDWTVLSGVGKVETDFGRSALPGVSSGTNSAGAAGPMQFEAATFAGYYVAASGSPPNLYDPTQAIAAAANYLAALGMTDPAQEQSALCHYNAGSGSAYQTCMADPGSYAAQVLSWAQRYRGTALATSGIIAGNLPWPELPLTDPVGTLSTIPPIAWPAGAQGHANPNAVTNQCVAGALWTWGVMHLSDPRWSPPPPLAEPMAWQEFGAAQEEGFQTTGPDQPVVGSMVVYASGWDGSGAGHIATVIAVSGTKFEVVEQNVVATSESLAGAWNVFDVRIDQAGSPGIEGFIVAPPQ